VIEQRLLDACTHCGFCLPTCPTYGALWQREEDSPRGRIHLMAGIVDGSVPLVAGTVEHFDRCLGCMACVTACPSGVRYDLLIEQTRAHVEERYERAPDEWLTRSLIFSTIPYPRRFRVMLPLARLGRRLPLPRTLKPFAELAPRWVSAKGLAEHTAPRTPGRMRVGLLTGCVQRVLFGDVNQASARVLAAEGCEVVAPRKQGCCGALHLHAGRAEEGRERARRLEQVFVRAGAEAIAVNAAGCGSHLKDAGLELPVLDISELLQELGPRAYRHELRTRVAFQDSCHLAHAQGVRDAPRAALRSVPGLELAEPAELAICWGSAGIYNLVQPEAARELGDRKGAHVLATGADVYATANPGCLVQVTAALGRAGRPLPALHPIELVDASIRGVTADRLLAGART
jgi:glycolate oxidase iron-sulfur subunit